MLKNFYVKNNTGSSVPLSTLVKITDIKGPEFLLRQNLYNSSKLMVTPAQGYSNSQAMEALEKTFEASMPSDMGYSYADMSYQEQKNPERYRHRADFPALLRLCLPDSGGPV